MREDATGATWLAVQWEAGWYKVKHLDAISAAVQSLSKVEWKTAAKHKMSFIRVDATSDFSYHNLPYGIFSTPDNVSALTHCSGFET